MVNYIQLGAVIMGAVDGNRIWGKELKEQLAHVAWSPDGRFVLFGTTHGKLQLYDNLGNYVSKVTNFFDGSNNIKIAAMDWYNGKNGFYEKGCPCLAVCFDNGKIQLLRNQFDSKPILVDTKMHSIKLQWNVNGSLLAVSGIQLVRSSQGEEKEACVVQLWSPYGELIKSLKVPGKSITSLSWENDGLRLALGVDAFIYFANIRNDYRWGALAKDVIVYTYNRQDSASPEVVFWNSKTNDRRSRYLILI